MVEKSDTTNHNRSKFKTQITKARQRVQGPRSRSRPKINLVRHHKRSQAKQPSGKVYSVLPCSGSMFTQARSRPHQLLIIACITLNPFRFLIFCIRQISQTSVLFKTPLNDHIIFSNTRDLDLVLRRAICCPD